MRVVIFTSGVHECGYELSWRAILKSAMAASDLDDAVVVIQQASKRIEDAVQKMGTYEGKQQELLTAIKEMGERVADLEKSTVSSRASKTKETCSPSPYERVGGWPSACKVQWAVS